MCLFSNSIYICVLFCTISMLIFPISVIIKRSLPPRFSTSKSDKAKWHQGERISFYDRTRFVFLARHLLTSSALTLTNTLELHDFNVIHVFDPTWSPGWSNSNTISVTITNTTESISNNVISSHMPFYPGPAITAFCNLCKQDSRHDFQQYPEDKWHQ